MLISITDFAAQCKISHQKVYGYVQQNPEIRQYLIKQDHQNYIDAESRGYQMLAERFLPAEQRKEQIAQKEVTQKQMEEKVEEMEKQLYQTERQLYSAIKLMDKTIQNQEQRLNNQEKQITKSTKKMIAATAVAGICMAILGFMVGKRHG